MSSATACSTSRPVLAPATGAAVSRGTHIQPSRTTTQGPEKKDWDSHRATIKRLYVDEDKTLKEVMSIMKGQHGLKGSVKMYKTRITRWRLDKNNKEHEIGVVLRKKTTRDAIGKATSFRIRGKLVNIEEVLRYCKRKANDVLPASSDPPTPSDISYWTSAPSPNGSVSPDDSEDGNIVTNHPLADNSSLGSVDLFLYSHASPTIPPFILPPQALLIPETLFAGIRSYFRYSLSTGTWISNSSSLRKLTSPKGEEQDAKGILINIYNARTFFLRREFAKFRQAMSRAFARVSSVLLAESPSALENFIDSVLWLIEEGMPELASMLRRFIYEMAAKTFPNHHPWYHVCRSIGLAETHDLDTLLRLSCLCVADNYELELGTFHFHAISCRAMALRTISSPNEELDTERQLRKLLDKCERFCGPLDPRSQEVMLAVGWQLLCQGKNAEAEALGGKVLQRAGSLDNGPMIRSLEIIAEAQYRGGNMLAAEANIREISDRIGKLYGWEEDAWKIEIMAKLEGWLREWGRDTEAAQIRAEITDLLGQDDDAEN